MIDWYSTQRAIVTKSRKSIDPYSLSDEELNALILGFGYPYPEEVKAESKSIFLHELIGYYQRKGTPKVLGEVLTFYGLINAVLCEWWVYHNELTKSLWVRSVPVWPKTREDFRDYYIEEPYESFVKLDPFWHYDKAGGEKLIDVYREPLNAGDDPSDPDTERLNRITLPSITPFISLNTFTKSDDIFPELAIMNRKIQESYQYWIKFVLKWKGAFENSEAFPEDRKSVV